jgi:hypothetical protein
MTYATVDARRQLLETIAGAADELGFALASLAEAYELIDEHAAQRLEAELFRPVRTAYAQAQRTYTDFAARCGLPSPALTTRAPGAPGGGAKGFLDSALDAIDRAEQALATLQDSMLPVEVGDVELRAGISGVRESLGGLRGRARELVRTLGR